MLEKSEVLSASSEGTCSSDDSVVLGESGDGGGARLEAVAVSVGDVTVGLGEVAAVAVGSADDVGGC